MKRGAIDYLSKPFGLDDLDVLLRRTSKTIVLEKENTFLKRQLRRTESNQASHRELVRFARG